ncbi:hypothetical protein J2S53_003073 [Actinopolyspora lacussalsi]|nr:hypothetical protein [Actinopolyspora lacussalsi]
MPGHGRQDPLEPFGGDPPMLEPPMLELHPWQGLYEGGEHFGDSWGGGVPRYSGADVGERDSLTNGEVVQHHCQVIQHQSER